MQRTLTLLVLVLTIAISQAEPYFPGAWYTTKAPAPNQKGAGAFDLKFYQDGTLALITYFKGEEIGYGEGFWTELKSGLMKFNVRDDFGFVFTGTVRNGFMTGKWRHSDNGYSGKFQATREDDGQN